MLFDGNDFQLEKTIIPKMNEYYVEKQNNKKIFTGEEGFIKANMFIDEYKTYKNYNPVKPRANNKREQLLIEIMKHNFLITDLGLYLDLHPDDKMIFNIFNESINDYKKLVDEYERIFGSLNLCDTSDEKYDWIDDPWAWDKIGGSMYV